MSAELSELLLDIDVDDALLVTLDETELDEAGIEETGLDESELDETGVDEAALDKDEALDNAPVDEVDEVSPGDELPPPHATNADIHTTPIKRVIVEYMLIPVIKSGSRLS
ncbi:hypothetical protein ACSV5M_13720 [Cellvibrio sp. ARAG 10.3]|uniref:hypothetical protein n=1 Tax=Cellvibrio sp. ARAG 10.3 TaxID=3451358 RepID=UPI003F485DFA